MACSLFNTVALGVVVASFLAGCGDSQHSDVQAWMREASKDLRGRVPELPQIKPLDVKPYESESYISPFAIDKVISGGAGNVAASSGRGGPPAVNTDAYPMAKAPLEAIRFIGTIIVNKEARALVQIEREPIRQIRVGDYMGQNHGKVLKIEPSSSDNSGLIVLKEKLFDKGVWVERETVFPAQDKGDSK